MLVIAVAVFVAVALAIAFVNPRPAASKGNDEVCCCRARMPDAIFDAFSLSEVGRVGEYGDGDIAGGGGEGDETRRGDGG